MNKALICVDVQNDFLPGGALGVDGGDSTVSALIDLMADVDVIVLTRDWHPTDHSSFSEDPEYVDGSWPQHCVQGTAGAKIDESLFCAALDSGKPVLLVHKGDDRDVEAYSGFDGVVVDCWNVYNGNLADDFRSATISLAEALLDYSVNKVIVGGLALDYCVRATALDSATKFPTTVRISATRPVAYATGASSLVDLIAAGVDVR